MSFLDHLEKMLDPFDHKVWLENLCYYVRLEDTVVALSIDFILHADSPTYDIHHTEECLKGQKVFYEFKEFIEDFGGYVPTPTCDCPRDKIPPNPEREARIIFNQLYRKNQSSARRVKT